MEASPSDDWWFHTSHRLLEIFIKTRMSRRVHSSSNLVPKSCLYLAKWVQKSIMTEQDTFQLSIQTCLSRWLIMKLFSLLPNLKFIVDRDIVKSVLWWLDGLNCLILIFTKWLLIELAIFAIDSKPFGAGNWSEKIDDDVPQWWWFTAEEKKMSADKMSCLCFLCFHMKQLCKNKA